MIGCRYEASLAFSIKIMYRLIRRARPLVNIVLNLLLNRSQLLIDRVRERLGTEADVPVAGAVQGAIGVG